MSSVPAGGLWSRDGLVGLAVIVALALAARYGVASDIGDRYSLYGIIVAVVITSLAIVIIVKMFTNEIDLSFLISEDNGHASLSRFQFLLFTFVIASCYFLLVVQCLIKGTPSALPEIPPGVLGLIGISGGSYVIAKGIQRSAGNAATKGQVTGVHVTAAGQNYGAGTTLAFAGGDGSGAAGTVTVTNGAITAVAITAPGTGYTSSPTVRFVDPTGAGTGATAVATTG